MGYRLRLHQLISFDSHSICSLISDSSFSSYSGFPGGSDSKESDGNAGDLGSVPWAGKIPQRREWLPTPVYLPGEFPGQRSLGGYSPWGCKESDTTELIILSHFHPIQPTHFRTTVKLTLTLKNINCRIKYNLK